jgi:hypothetical protein
MKLKFIIEISVNEAYLAACESGIVPYLRMSCGAGDFCVKLISAKSGRNLLVGKYRFFIG